MWKCFFLICSRAFSFVMWGRLAFFQRTQIVLVNSDDSEVGGGVGTLGQCRQELRVRSWLCWATLDRSWASGFSLLVCEIGGHNTLHRRTAVKNSSKWDTIWKRTLEITELPKCQVAVAPPTFSLFELRGIQSTEVPGPKMLCLIWFSDIFQDSVKSPHWHKPS